MSDDAIIHVENLGKRYRISHQQPGRRYVALRDVIAEKAKNLFKIRKAESRKQKSDSTEGQNQFQLSKFPISTLPAH